jgi:AraC-like DNA-binding protein
MLEFENFSLNLADAKSNLRIPLWMDWHHKIFKDYIIPIEFGSGDVDGSVELRGFAQGQMVKIRPASQKIIKKSHKSIDSACLTIILQLSGNSSIKGAGNDLFLESNDIAFVANTELEKTISPNAEMVLLNIPMPLVLSRQPNIQALVGIGYKNHRPEIELVKNAICGAYNILPRISRSQHNNLLLSIIELLGIPEPERLDRPKSEKRFDSSMKYVESYLGDQDFNADKLADLVHISRRRLDEIFVEKIGKSIANYIWDRRLERAANILDGQDGVRWSITDIAMANGFSDISHFSRAFKKRYGKSPVAFRRCQIDPEGPMRIR